MTLLPPKTMATENDDNDDMPVYEHPVSRAMADPSDNNLGNLNRNQKVYVLCHLAGVDTPDAHPDDYTGGVSIEILDDVIESLRDAQVSEE